MPMFKSNLPSIWRKNIAVFVVVSTALIYWLVAYLIEDASALSDGYAGYDFLLSMFYMIGLFAPCAKFGVEHFQIESWKEAKATKMSAEQIHLSIVLTRYYTNLFNCLLGMVAFMITHDMMNMFWFYLIALGWAFVLWPTEKRQKKLMERIEKND